MYRSKFSLSKRSWFITLALLTIAFIAYNSFANPKYWKTEWSKTDFSKSSVNLDDIISGGPAKDGIPSIDNPKFAPVADIDYIKNSEPVISININGDARAYPLRVLTWHEIANDTVGGTPVAVTYCPLCNASIVFDRRVDGITTEFGVTGKLHKSDMIMYDRNTESWWQQYLGEAIVGEQLGKKLKVIPSRVESLAIFRKRFPNGKALEPNNKFSRDYGTNPYVGYDTGTPFLYNGEYNGTLPQMTYLVVVGDDAWPLEHLKKKSRIEKEDIVIEWVAYQNSSLDTREISKGRDLGNVSVERVLPDGRRKDIAYGITFAFVFDAFHPNGVVHLD